MKKRMCICLAFLLLFCGGMMAAGAKDENILQGIVAEYVNNTNPPGGSANVPVDCAAVRYVKKPAGARPGMVTYTNARTLYVIPDADEAKALSTERKGKNGGEVRN